MITFFDVEINMPHCIVCGAELVFNSEWVFAPIASQCIVNLQCLCCGDESQVVRIQSGVHSARFARKKTYHTGARADYEDTYGYIRYTRRMRRLVLFVPRIAENMGVSYELASNAYQSFRASKDSDRYSLPFIVRYNNEISDLPF